ncbi:MAG: hypothetical protein E7317_09420 [Clostridiales bacterium]|nr:hypothetical protein [Clostridiales bacterium]
MKKVFLSISLAVMALLLAACGQKAAETAPSTAAPAAQEESAEKASLPAAAALSQPPAFEEDKVDLDLTAISGTVVYSQVYAMLEDPQQYEGQRVKMCGGFSYFQDPQTNKEYFAAVIADATACCSQGIEFVWKGEHAYPADYPELGTDVTVTGLFDTYLEDGYTYIQLVDADVTWES